MKARVISAIPYDQVGNSFDGVVTSDESWFVCIYLFDYMFAAGRNEIVPREKADDRGAKSYVDDFSPSCV
jgi:hypothetical protein